MRWAAALGVLVCVLVAGLAVHGGGEGPSSSDKFLTQALGEKRPGAPLVRRPAPGVRVRVDSSGFRVSHKQTQVAISLAGAKRSKWERFADGVSRPTAYGRETIVVDSTGTEQFLTVERRQGKHDWQWRLDTDARPRLQPDGSIIYGAGLARTPPVAILDAGGKDVTPDGLRWSLREQDGSWRLGLRLDDSKLPFPTSSTRPWTTLSALPFQPGVDRDRIVEADHGGAECFQHRDEHDAGSERHRVLPLDSGRGEHDSRCAPGESHRHGLGARHCRRHGLPDRQLGVHGHDRHPERDLVAGAAILNVGIWKGTIAAGVFTPTGTVLAPTNDPVAQNLRPSVNPTTTNVTISVPRFALGRERTSVRRVPPQPDRQHQHRNGYRRS